MAIEVVPAQLYALADVLGAGAAQLDRAAAALDVEPVGGPLDGALTGFCETVQTAARCLAGELGWLDGAVSTAADSWLGLDRSLLPVAGQGVAR
jgi:hypothetical protein